MPRLKEESRAGRQEALLDAARVSFAELGFEAASIAAIARRAGVSDGLLYRYFADKRSLLAAVLERYMEETIARAEAALRDAGDFPSRLERLIESQLAAFAEDPDICDLYIRELRDTGAVAAGSPLRLATRRYTDLLLAMVTDAAKRGEIAQDTDARMVRDLVFGGIEHIAWHSLSGGPALQVQPTAARLARLIARGVGAEVR
jgi:TetR/AcrR family transcriptional regulator, fatty acid metabolism regulator protein